MNETLEEYAERIKNMTKRELKSADINFDAAMEMVNNCKELKNTITYQELKMLYYIRNCRLGDFQLFFRVAKLNYEAYCAFLKLKNNN